MGIGPIELARLARDRPRLKIAVVDPDHRHRLRVVAADEDLVGIEEIVVVTGFRDDLVDEVVARVGAVVLTVSATHTVEAHAAASWAADHAAELGADAARIALVGHGAGAALAERVAELSVDEGWPPLRHVALIWPHDDPAAALDGLTRALAAHHPHRPTRSPR